MRPQLTGYWLVNMQLEKATRKRHEAMHVISSLAFALAVFAISLAMFEYATGGDQLRYRAFYEGVPEVGIGDLLPYQYSIIGSTEPLYALIAFLAAECLSKDVFASLLNGMFAYLTARYLFGLRMHWLVIVTLIFTNYYFFALYLSHERLKFALIFVLLAIGTGKTRYAGLLLAPLAHVQVLLFYASAGVPYVLRRIPDVLLRWRIKKMDVLLMVVGMIVALAAVSILGEHIAGKLMSYQNDDVFSLAKLLALFTLALLVARERMTCLFMFSPLFLAAFFVGDERVNIFGFFLFMYFSAQRRRGLNFPTLVLLGYFLLQGIEFMRKIIVFGDGYVPV